MIHAEVISSFKMMPGAVNISEIEFTGQDVSCVAEDEENCTEDTEGRTDEMLESDDLWSVSYGIGRVRSVA
ncbi:unnamed protein product [Onchocerca flexuosa]|uniref:MAM domain-containing protein n=1 Tax=Onchocerca flexuosa TaxID=387005 RepID=A0A183HK02_9BILA|nr:unnamed protein product [Onchocerca flexuosa]